MDDERLMTKEEALGYLKEAVDTAISELKSDFLKCKGPFDSVEDVEKSIINLKMTMDNNDSQIGQQLFICDCTGVSKDDINRCTMGYRMLDDHARRKIRKLADKYGLW